MSRRNVVERSNQWGGWRIRPGKDGWLVSSWSSVTGTITGRIKQVPYSVVPRTTDLGGRDLLPELPFPVTNADVLAGIHFPSRTIKNGRLVR
jgi:hypothetical protein